MSTGKIKFFNESKGFGFIINDIDGKEYYYHATGSLDRAEKGDKVSFEISENSIPGFIFQRNLTSEFNKGCKSHSIELIE